MTEPLPSPGDPSNADEPGSGAGERPPITLETGPVGEIVEAAFGAENRARLLEQYFTSGIGSRKSLTVGNAWEHTYRLLLWIDRTTNLAHCYESDKCQPGKPWYARSLGFHRWLADTLQVPAGDVARHIDTLFGQVTRQLAVATAARINKQAAKAASQRQAWQGLPEPGADSQLEAILVDALSPYLAEQPPPAVLRTLTQQITTYVGRENKRKNLLGEGFEDTLAALLVRLPGIAQRYEIRVRPVLHDLPGFNPPRGTEKASEVDLALVHRTTQRRVLVTCKWSVRSDREGQFPTDFRAYAALESAGQDFDYVLLTNEFDPARLAAACQMRRENALLFTDVVHINTDGPLAAYTAAFDTHADSGMIRAVGHVESGRLSSLGDWLERLRATP